MSPGFGRGFFFMRSSLGFFAPRNRMRARKAFFGSRFSQQHQGSSKKERIVPSIALVDHLGSIASILGLIIGLPAVLAAVYQSHAASVEVRQVCEGTMHLRDCLEFVSGDGTCINIVPLETLHTLPKQGDVILLPGQGIGEGSEFLPGAYLVESIEHFYTPATHKLRRPHEARLTKAVCLVTSLNPHFNAAGLNSSQNAVNAANVT